MNKGNENKANCLKFLRFFKEGSIRKPVSRKKLILPYSNYDIKCFVIYFQSEK